jgi:hypothetical protein
MVGVEQRMHCTEGASHITYGLRVSRRRRPPPRLPPGSLVSGMAADKLARRKFEMSVRAGSEVSSEVRIRCRGCATGCVPRGMSPGFAFGWGALGCSFGTVESAFLPRLESRRSGCRGGVGEPAASEATTNGAARKGSEGRRAVASGSSVRAPSCRHIDEVRGLCGRTKPDDAATRRVSILRVRCRRADQIPRNRGRSFDAR